MADSIIYDLIPSPNASELGMTVEVPISVFSQAPNFRMPTVSTNGVTGDRYGSAAFKFLASTSWLKGYSDYVLINATKNRPQWITFHFCKPTGDDYLENAFRTDEWKDNHYWHIILLQLKPIKIDFPLAVSVGAGSTNTNASRYRMRQVYIPAATEGTGFVEEEILSDTPPEIPQDPVPIASAVTYDWIDREGAFPECIHGNLTIPRIPTVTGSSIPEQHFPATNFPTWTPYVLRTSKPVLTAGGWYFTRLRVYPPPMPEKVRKLVK